MSSVAFRERSAPSYHLAVGSSARERAGEAYKSIVASK